MKPPRNSKEVSKFLGMSQWYAKFIKNYADLCGTLYNLKRKFKKKWPIEAQKAFDAVKVAITKAPVLKFPDFKNPFELFTDASSIGLGAVLNQEQRTVVFASRTLSTAERYYTVTEKECLAVVWALNKFRTYLCSLPIKRGRHNREDQLDAEKAEEKTIAPTSKSEQDEATRMPDDQQRQDQERKGACTIKSISLKVLVGNANYKS
ncbi:retrovirus-related Pol polyprotein from transposon 297 [Trichonephila clavipes]|nr:retrovirus-related Pol polyprotein from transposon 297 [Trichonephila clavipes]